MTTHPTICHGDVLVVLEGRRRLTWYRHGRAEWSPVALWPNAQQADRIRRRIATGEPLLIVAEAPEASIAVLDEQLRGAPPAVTALAGGEAGEVVDLTIPAFDWLPEELRRRGLAFLRESAAAARELPAALAPSIVLEEPPPRGRGVRFAHVLRDAHAVHRDLADIAAEAFAERRLAAVA